MKFFVGFVCCLFLLWQNNVVSKGIDDSVSGRYVVRQVKRLEIDVHEQDIKDAWEEYKKTHNILPKNYNKRFEMFRDQELRKRGFYKESQIKVHGPKVFQKIYADA